MDLPRDDELDSFLQKVEEIEKVVKGLNSDDHEQVDKNMKLADKLIKTDKEELEVEGVKTKTGINKSFINKYNENDPKNSNPVGNPNNMSQDAFLAYMEKDAQERYERKQKNTKLANQLKDKGNIEFQNKNYEKAIDLYTEALQYVKDIPAIYTNRAQAYNIIGKYNEAINDCDWALRVDEKCTKGYIHKGKAYTFLKEFDKAQVEFEAAKKYDPKQTKLIDEYIKEMERLRVAHNQEKAADIFLLSKKDGAKNNLVDNFLEILEKKLNIKGQDTWYYSGGLRCLGSLSDDETKKTLFRTKNGFKLFEDHPVVTKFFNESVNLKKLNSSEIDLLCTCFELLQTICLECDENIRSIFKINKFSTILINILNQINNENQSVPVKTLKLEILKLLVALSKNDFGILQIINNTNLNKLVESILEKANDKDLSLKEKSIIFIQNLSLDSKFHSKLSSENVKFVVEKLCLILNSQEKLSEILKTSIVTIIYALTSQTNFLKVMIKIDKLWTELLNIMVAIPVQKEEFQTLPNVVVSLLTNMSSSKSDNLESQSEKIIEQLLRFSGPLNNQTLGLLGNLIQNINNREKVFKFLDKKFIEKLVQNIKSRNEKMVKSVKLLALCTQNETSFRNRLVELDKTLGFFYDLFKNVSQTTVDQDPTQSDKNKHLNLKKLNETLISNCVLCMSHCVETDQKLAKRLAETNIVMDLLYLTRDGFNVDMQKNCGILLAKMAKQDEKHLMRLRELNGVEILYSALKNTNI